MLPNPINGHESTIDVSINSISNDYEPPRPRIFQAETATVPTAADDDWGTLSDDSEDASVVDPLVHTLTNDRGHRRHRRMQIPPFVRPTLDQLRQLFSFPRDGANGGGGGCGFGQRVRCAIARSVGALRAHLACIGVGSTARAVCDAVNPRPHGDEGQRTVFRQENRTE
jgi:hypothetical protein